ncbi:MAG: pantetheine-phosphate adenylyltransferase [Flavobacteriaceae bacterium]|jgi:pantetheine-phosphate adenylyltransferase|nr:pantetheine-phosphate adenylyltransferase [Flavobacteriaceae bacterium]CAI8377298.1 MAG: Phosphopantetheine adenylyltransferase [Flavobacteriaceae bacterium]|tara:strand:- start:269 stop:730 length:462 start_codon:yes stop_codon:yes gene_type:complete
MKKAVFPGSFDPLTLGHCDIIDRSIKLFDEIIVAVGINSSKKCMFTLEERKKFINTHYINEPKVKIMVYEGLTVDFCKKNQADFILRGLRNPADFEFEKAIAQTNRKLTSIDTVFFLTSANNSYISSSIVREVIINNGDYTKLVPACVRKDYF